MNTSCQLKTPTTAIGTPTKAEDVLSRYTVKFLNWLSHEQLVKTLFESKAGIIIPNPNERYKTNYPVKLSEFMASAIPSIASREGESAAFIKECNGGILVDPLNVDEVAQAITWLFEHPEESKAMGKRAQELIFTKYNREKESEVLLNLYEGLSKF